MREGTAAGPGRLPVAGRSMRAKIAFSSLPSAERDLSYAFRPYTDQEHGASQDYLPVRAPRPRVNECPARQGGALSRETLVVDYACKFLPERVSRMRSRLATAAVVALLVLVLLPAAAGAAPIDTPSEDRHQTMLLTALVAGGILALASIGFLYRRMKGMVTPPEDTSHSGEHH